MTNPVKTNSGAIRCAIYTRKSTEEGLEQEFNTLDAQRESAEAYIASQRHEGWACLPDRYDDGGFSGGTLERPALKRLMADIEAGGIDCVVVYKVDRLSRSLLDFSRLMEIFERHGVSFVSVTQQFNTTHSMGRLTLNILLSFAQFEREIIAERTKDKMWAARKKGKWIGGMPVLGYDVAEGGGRLEINAEEAARVRAIFQLYLEMESLLPTAQELERRGWNNKRWVTRKGKERGGKPFNKSTLFRLLTNPIYKGKVLFQGTTYDGEHEAIVDMETWNKVQGILRRNRLNGGTLVRNKYGALLKGLLFCTPCGTGMTHSYAKRKNGKCYRYYVCQTAQRQGWAKCPTKSVNAYDIESAVVEHIKGLGANPAILSATLTKATEQAKARLNELEMERKSAERELKRLHAQIRKLLGGALPDGASEIATDRLADLQERIRTIEQRMKAIQEEILVLGKTTIKENDLTQALADFDEVWNSLSSKEQAKIIHLLVERVGFDGRDQSVTVTFRSEGLKQLCQRTAA